MGNIRHVYMESTTIDKITPLLKGNKFPGKAAGSLGCSAPKGR